MFEVWIRVEFKSHFKVWFKFGGLLCGCLRARFLLGIQAKCRLMFEVMFMFMCRVWFRAWFRVWCNVMFKVELRSGVEYII
jgi:hypothetical protein